MRKPVPAPSSSTLTTDVNVATTPVGADTGNEQTGPDPLHGPLQPVNVDAESAVRREGHGGSDGERGRAGRAAVEARG